VPAIPALKALTSNWLIRAGVRADVQIVAGQPHGMAACDVTS
jgi:hypothetical protein